MSFKSRLKTLFKSVAVWWGIFIILGCCAGFVYRMMFSVLFISDNGEKFNAGIFIPLLLAGSLILAFIFCGARSVILRAPTLLMKSKLRNILIEYGISDEYIRFLMENCRGVMKDRILLEVCNAHNLLGNSAQAAEVHSKLDINYIKNIAADSGDLYNAAFYYCQKMIISFFRDDIVEFDNAYNSAVLFFQHMERNYRVEVAKGLYHYAHKEYRECISVLEKAKLGNKNLFEYKYALGTVSALRGAAYLALGDYDKAKNHIHLAADSRITDFFDGCMGKMLNECSQNCADNQN